MCPRQGPRHLERPSTDKGQQGHRGEPLRTDRLDAEDVENVVPRPARRFGSTSRCIARKDARTVDETASACRARPASVANRAAAVLNGSMIPTSPLRHPPNVSSRAATGSARTSPEPGPSIAGGRAPLCPDQAKVKPVAVDVLDISSALPSRVAASSLLGQSTLARRIRAPSETCPATLRPLVEQLKIDGVAIIPNVFSPEQIERFRCEHDVLFDKVRSSIAAQTPTVIEYITHFDRAYRTRKNTFEVDGTQVLELAKGRYDFSCGMQRGVFAQDEFRYPSPVAELMRELLRRDYHSSVGALPSIANSDDGPWHRDTYHLTDDREEEDGTYDDTIEVKALPPFYYTALIPLVPLTETNGATEFIKGSHRLTYAEAVAQPRLMFDVDPGSVVLFDGRIFHRGRANDTAELRTVLYHVYCKNWYNDA